RFSAHDWLKPLDQRWPKSGEVPQKDSAQVARSESFQYNNLGCRPIGSGGQEDVTSNFLAQCTRGIWDRPWLKRFSRATVEREFMQEISFLPTWTWSWLTTRPVPGLWSPSIRSHRKFLTPRRFSFLSTMLFPAPVWRCRSSRRRFGSLPTSRGFQL